MTGEEATAEMIVPSTTIIDHHHPLYLQASDSPGLVIILIKLIGLENYSLWSRLMKLALQGKCKLGFVDENCTKIKFKGKLEELWEKCNACNCVVMADPKHKITILRHGTDSVTSYYSRMKNLWNELDVMFLMGLNETYSNLMSHILSRNANVTVNEAYATMAQEESQKSLGMVDTQKDHLAMIAGKAQGYRPKRPGGHGGSGGVGRGHGGSRGAGYLVSIVVTKVI
ncbi:hypothetical protein KY285_010098 [Solanum tuberosum]|nr:hypothetical protein KY285_010098 [Solanum tuberosum]